ncbi:MAG: hypothetical protein HKP58_10450 [Desulfatitalea sp.]|nr:hypothetical protein [Desulfatitalea sp.]NNK00821.1 hypothetical protein [Desulfatitalea sp.]
MSHSEIKTMKRQPGEFRLPRIKTAADIEALSHLSKEEKDLAMFNLNKEPPTDGWTMMINDPELQAFWSMMQSEFIALFDGDFIAIPFSFMNLTTLVTVKHTNSNWHYGFLTAWTGKQIGAHKLPEISYAKLAQLDYPDADVWTDEERLIIKFAVALLEHSMSDELFDQARAAFGDKKVLRGIAWVGYVKMWAMLVDALDLKYLATMDLPAMPPEIVETLTSSFQNIRPEMKSLWMNMKAS